MATPSWKYPDTTAPSSTIEFPRGELIKDTPSPVGNTVTEVSEYGEVFTRSMGADWIEIPFGFIVPSATQAGNTADKSKVETFLGTTVGWGARPFYYTDSAGTARKVKCLSTRIWVGRWPNYIEGSVMLRTVE